jgi:hypothetical protein
MPMIFFTCALKAKNDYILCWTGFATLSVLLLLDRVCNPVHHVWKLKEQIANLLLLSLIRFCWTGFVCWTGFATPSVLFGN